MLPVPETTLSCVLGWVGREEKFVRLEGIQGSASPRNLKDSRTFPAIKAPVHMKNSLNPTPSQNLFSKKTLEITFKGVEGGCYIIYIFI